MAVRATLRNGATVTLADDVGTTPAEILARIEEATHSGLTGSAVPDLWLGTTDGGSVRYAEVWKLDPVPDE